VGLVRAGTPLSPASILDSKYEAVSVDSGYKVYMKLHIRNITKEDFMEYRSALESGKVG
jgi:hypothetical protein